MRFLSQQEMQDFDNKRVIVRVDFNVPINESGEVSEDESYRIHAVKQTIEWLQNANAKIILLSHIGRSGDSLHPIAEYIQKNIPEWKLEFCPELISEAVQKTIGEMENRTCILLENVRMDSREESNDIDFAKALSEYGDYYINDAFGACHRSHASVVGIPEFLPSYAGFLIETELHQLRRAFQPIKPSVLIMAGVKFETKLPLIEKLSDQYETIILGGGLLNTFLSQYGYAIGKSVFDKDAKLDSILKNKKIVIPDHVVVERNNSLVITIPVQKVLENDVIVDIVISHDIQKKIENAQTVVWNGPLGWYERGYTESSRDVALALFPEEQFSIVGGGDTVTMLRKEKLDRRITFLSTGGGAMLEYLEQGTLPGLQVLQ